MRSLKCLFGYAALIALIVTASAGPSLAAEAEALALKRGDTVTLGVRRITVKRLDTLPYVDSEYSKRYRFDTFDNPKLKELRECHHLDDVVAPGKSEFDRQVLLLDWANHRLKKFGK